MKDQKLIVIFDYDLGNLSSLVNSIKTLGHKVNISKNKNILLQADFIILPGVGNFNEAINNLKKNNMINFLKKNNKKIIGICLGMQILCKSSEESIENKGLNLIDGKIIKLKEKNIGWQKININKKYNKFKFCDKSFFYFNHSYFYKGRKVVAYCNGKTKIPAIIKIKNIIGVQFHPEKSQDSGLSFLKKLFFCENLFE